MHRFEDLRMWQAAKQLEAEIIRRFTQRACRQVPGIRAQIIEAAGSVGSNIAEGAGRSSDKEFQYFLDCSIGSLNEVRDRLLSARNGKVIHANTYTALNNRALAIRRMIVRFKRWLASNSGEK